MYKTIRTQEHNMTESKMEWLKAENAHAPDVCLCV